MAIVFTPDKIAIILSVTAIVVVLAYVFRIGMFSRRKGTGTNPDKSPQRPSDSVR